MRMLNCVCHSHLPPRCLAKAELPTQSSSFLSMVQLWSPCGSRSLSLMLSVNEAACIVPGVMRRHHDLHAELEGSSSSAAVLACLAPCNRELRSHAHFQRRFASWVREEGEGCTGRHCQEVACPFTVISASVELTHLHQISWLLRSDGNVAAAMNCQPSTILFLHSVSSKMILYPV